MACLAILLSALTLSEAAWGTPSASEVTSAVLGKPHMAAKPCVFTRKEACLPTPGKEMPARVSRLGGHQKRGGENASPAPTGASLGPSEPPCVIEDPT